MFKKKHIHVRILKYLILVFICVLTVQLLSEGELAPLKHVQRKALIQIKETFNAFDEADPGQNIAAYSYLEDEITLHFASGIETPAKIYINKFSGTTVYFRELQPSEFTDPVKLNISFLHSGVYFISIQVDNEKMTRLFIRS